METTNEQIKSNAYELAYHIIPDIEEADLIAEQKKIESIITSNGGSISLSLEPKRKHLSYPINHKHYGFFGVIDFVAPTESILLMENQAKLDTQILRYMFVKKSEHKEVRTLGEVRHRTNKQEDVMKLEDNTPIAEKSPEQEKKLESDIEDVLEKI